MLVPLVQVAAFDASSAQGRAGGAGDKGLSQHNMAFLRRERRRFKTLLFALELGRADIALKRVVLPRFSLWPLPRDAFLLSFENCAYR